MTQNRGQEHTVGIKARARQGCQFEWFQSQISLFVLYKSEICPRKIYKMATLVSVSSQQQKKLDLDFGLEAF